MLQILTAVLAYKVNWDRQPRAEKNVQKTSEEIISNKLRHKKLAQCFYMSQSNLEDTAIR